MPDPPFCARGTAQLYDRMGEVARGRQWMAIYLEKKKEPDVAAEQEYGRLLMKGRRRCNRPARIRGELF